MLLVFLLKKPPLLDLTAIPATGCLVLVQAGLACVAVWVDRKAGQTRSASAAVSPSPRRDTSMRGEPRFLSNGLTLG